MKAVVIGASGLVGRSLIRALAARGLSVQGAYHTRGGPGLQPLDIADSAQVEAFVARHAPSVVFLPAALTAVDYCEDHQEEAWRVNVDGPRNVARAAARVRAKPVFYSTEYVFDGSAGPYSEDDPISPQSVYACSKAAGEQAVRDEAADHLILRTTVVYGWDPTSRNFAMQLFQRLSAGERMRVPCDQIGNPTLVDFLADASLQLIERDVLGVVNVVGRDRVARTEFAVRFARRLGLDERLIDPVPTIQLSQIAPRPLNAGLTTDKLASILETPPLGLDEALDRFVEAMSG